MKEDRHMKCFFNFFLFIMSLLITVDCVAQSPNEIKLINTGGVYEVPVVLNGVLAINVILDSGASDVSISPDVALTLLRTKTITDEDWLPGAYYQFADGSRAKSMRFKMKSVKIGNTELTDVTCSVSNSINAPMLLGQSALQKLGKYSIDYKKMVITFGDVFDNYRDTKKFLVAEKAHFAKISKAYPDYKQYVDDGSLKQWIEEQPVPIRKEMQRVCEQGTANEVIKLLSQFKKFQNSAEGWLSKAIDSNNNERAIEYLNQAISLKPDYADAYRIRGRAYADLDDYKSAIDDYKKAISLEPDYPVSYLKMGIVYANFGQYQVAIENYNQFISLKSSTKYNSYLYDFYFNRGFAYHKIGQNKLAIKDFDNAISLSSTHAAYHKRGLVNMALNNYENACIDLKIACESNTNYCKEIEQAIEETHRCECKTKEWLDKKRYCRPYYTR